MDKKSRKELLEKYKEIKTFMGVVRIKNNVNGKIFVAGYPNLKNKWLTLQARLNSGSHMNSQLQKDWNFFGADAFSYEVLEEHKTDDIIDIRWEVKQLEKKWFERLQPYGEKGYNKPQITAGS